MGIVEANFLNENAKSQLKQDPVESGEFSDVGQSSKLHRFVHEKCHWDTYNSLVEYNLHHNLGQTVHVNRFICTRLDLVSTNKGWLIGHIENRVNASKNPVDQNGEYRRSKDPERHRVIA